MNIICEHHYVTLNYRKADKLQSHHPIGQVLVLENASGIDKLESEQEQEGRGGITRPALSGTERSTSFIHAQGLPREK